MLLSLDSLINALPHAIVALNLRGEILACNTAATNQFDISELNSNSANITDYFCFDKNDRLHEQLSQLDMSQQDLSIHAKTDSFSKLQKNLVITFSKLLDPNLEESIFLANIHELESTPKGLLPKDTLSDRILDNSWNELYVFNAESLKCIMMSLGARNNIGVLKDSFHQFCFTDFLIDTTPEQFFVFAKELFNGESTHLVYDSELKRVDGTTYPAEIRLQLSHDEGHPLFLANVQDISGRKKIENRLTYLASYDALTGLPNRSLFMDRLNMSMEMAKRTETLVAVIFMDLDGFKKVNDTYGHEVGDQLIRKVANRVSKSIRKSDTAARLGGDEFTIILNNLKHINNAEVVIQKIIDSVCEPFTIHNKVIHTSPSLGVTLYPFCDTDDSLELLRQADIAMYHAKDSGKRVSKQYSSTLTEKEVRYAKLERGVRWALKQKAFNIHYQPRIDLSTNRIIGAEALLRWHDENLGNVSPAEFIPLLEATGLITELGSWVLEESCKQLRRWMDDGFDLRLSVNVSARQFDGNKFNKLLSQVLIDLDLPAEYLEIEITEGVLISQSEEAADSLLNLKKMGVILSLDDFGTGYSSLGYLKQFPIDILKIDRSFVMDLHKDKDSLGIVEAIIGLAKNLKLKVVAEGIEEQWHAEFLTQRGCDEGQGFFFGKAMPPEELEKLILEQACFKKAVDS